MQTNPEATYSSHPILFHRSQSFHPLVGKHVYVSVRPYSQSSRKDVSIALVCVQRFNSLIPHTLLHCHAVSHWLRGFNGRSWSVFAWEFQCFFSVNATSNYSAVVGGKRTLESHTNSLTRTLLALKILSCHPQPHLQNRKRELIPLTRPLHSSSIRTRCYSRVLLQQFIARILPFSYIF